MILFIYSWETHKERQRHWQREKQDPELQDHALSQKQTLNRWATQMSQNGEFFLKNPSPIQISDLGIVSCSSEGFKLATSTMIPKWNQRLLFCPFILAVGLIYKNEHLDMLVVNSVATCEILPWWSISD